MEMKDLLKQLEDLKDHCESMRSIDGDGIWEKDSAAIDQSIQILRKEGKRNMCSVCLNSPCDYRCPNAEEMLPQHYCISCDCGIEHGKNYLDTIEGKICEGCMEDMSVREILELCGMELVSA